MGASTTKTARDGLTPHQRPQTDRPTTETTVATSGTTDEATSGAAAGPTSGETAGATGAKAGARGAETASAGRPRAARRPSVWFEIVLVAVFYAVYSAIRNAVPEQRQQALDNADSVWRAEHALGIAVEDAVNRAADSVTWLIVSMNYYYATLHFVVTVVVLVWLYCAHPGRYAATRLVVFATTGVALIGYYLFPLAPPRLMRGDSFIDTVQVHQTWGSMASGNLADMSNQYAAMPSMHVGWSVWCGLAVAALVRPLWLRALGIAYPLLTLIVIVCTANHFWLDAVGGVLCLGFGLVLSRLWYGALPYRLPRRAAPSRTGAAQSRAAESGASRPVRV